MKDQTQNNQALKDQSDRAVLLTPGEESSAPESASLFQLGWRFAFGFLGWFLAIWLIYWSVLNRDPDPQGYGTMALSMLVFPAQIFALFVLFVVKDFRKIGWGMLSAIGVNLLISMILGLGLNAVCFIPFFFQ